MRRHRDLRPFPCQITQPLPEVSSHQLVHLCPERFGLEIGEHGAQRICAASCERGEFAGLLGEQHGLNRSQLREGAIGGGLFTPSPTAT